MPHMSDTDSTYSMNPRAARPTALGDLRFAGTVATGLIAGTLGLGALAAPLVGWEDWPSALTQQATSQPVVLAKAAKPKARDEQTPRKGQPGPRSESVLDNLGLPGAGGGAAAPGGLATLINTPSPRPPPPAPGAISPSLPPRVRRTRPAATAATPRFRPRPPSRRPTSTSTTTRFRMRPTLA